MKNVNLPVFRKENINNKFNNELKIRRELREAYEQSGFYQNNDEEIDNLIEIVRMPDDKEIDNLIEIVRMPDDKEPVQTILSRLKKANITTLLLLVVALQAFYINWLLETRPPVLTDKQIVEIAQKINLTEANKQLVSVPRIVLGGN